MRPLDQADGVNDIDSASRRHLVGEAILCCLILRFGQTVQARIRGDATLEREKGARSVEQRSSGSLQTVSSERRLRTHHHARSRSCPMRTVQRGEKAVCVACDLGCQDIS